MGKQTKIFAAGGRNASGGEANERRSQLASPVARWVEISDELQVGERRDQRVRG